LAEDGLWTLGWSLVVDLTHLDPQVMYLAG